MPNIGQMMDNSRVRLGVATSAQHPTDREVLLHLSTELQTYMNELSLSAKPWAVDELQLVVVPNQEDYALPIGSQFGKPLRVSTWYPSNPDQIVRDIDFYELTDTNFDWNLPQNVASLFYNSDGSPNTALRIAFYRRGGVDQIYARIIPLPMATATYKILYQLGEFGRTEALATVPVLPQHHALIEVRTALSLLPLTEWDDDKAGNAARRKELGQTLALTAARLENTFQQYIRTVTISRRPSRRSGYSIG